VLSAGIKLTQLGRAEGALPFFEHVRGLDPSYLVNLKTLAAAYLEAGQPEPAAHTARQILELSPSDPQTPGLFAIALVELGFAEEALSVAASDPLLFTRLVNVAVANFALGRSSDFDAALRTTGDQPQTLSEVPMPTTPRAEKSHVALPTFCQRSTQTYATPRNSIRRRRPGTKPHAAQRNQTQTASANLKTGGRKPSWLDSSGLRLHPRSGLPVPPREHGAQRRESHPLRLKNQRCFGLRKRSKHP
jgi:tetratricopeptide (TPR) repeat protein